MKRLAGFRVNTIVLRKLLGVALVLALSASPAIAAAITVNLDPGPHGSSFTFKEFSFGDLVGIGHDGQTLSVDVWFSGAFLMAPSISMTLFLNQTGGLGTWPTDGYGVIGYLLDGAGAPASEAKALPVSALMPGQMWPGWPFTLDGSPFLPPTIGHGMELEGAISPTADPRVFLIAPVLFSGLHFDITLPNSAESLIGSRLIIGNNTASDPFRAPVSVSPDPMPVYSYTVPDGGGNAGLLLFFGLAAVVAAVRLSQ